MVNKRFLKFKFEKVEIESLKNLNVAKIRHKSPKEVVIKPAGFGQLKLQILIILLTGRSMVQPKDTNSHVIKRTIRYNYKFRFSYYENKKDGQLKWQILNIL